MAQWHRSWLLAAAAVAAVTAACASGSAPRPTASVPAGSAVTATPASTQDGFRSLAPGWRTDFSRAVVPASEFLSGGPGKDGIPAVDAPQFEPVTDAAKILDGRAPVLALEVNGAARAYPVEILVWHELVNDVVGGTPVAISYCPLCNSSVVFDRTVAGRVLDFGVSGLLRNSDLVMYDRQTESWWQQITGEALVGSYAGSHLKQLPASTIAFADFRAAHPEGKVLSRKTGFQRDYGRNPYTGYDQPGTSPFLFRGTPDARLDAVDRVVTVDIGGDAVAYPFSRLVDHPVVNDTVGGQPIVVLYRRGVVSPLDRSSINESKDVGEGVVYLRTVGDRLLTFAWRDGAFRDAETGSSWDITGRATAGPLAGSRLPLVLHGNHFWFAWAAFQPGTRVWSP